MRPGDIFFKYIGTNLKTQMKIEEFLWNQWRVSVEAMTQFHFDGIHPRHVQMRRTTTALSTTLSGAIISEENERHYVLQ